MGRSQRWAPPAVVGLAGLALAAGAVWLNLAAGAGVPSDTARGLSVQVPITAMGLLLVAHRPSNRIGPLALAAGTVLGCTLLAAGLLRYHGLGHPIPEAAVHAAFAAVLLLGWPLTALWLFALLAFPEGNAPPARVARWAWAAVAAHGAVAFGSYLTAARTDVPSYLQSLRLDAGGGPLAPGGHDLLAAVNNVLLLAVPAGGVAVVVVLGSRCGPVVRQQLKWLLPALALQLVVHMAVPTSAEPWHGWRAAGELAVLAAPAIGAAAIAVAVFRYRLWEFDAVISKALVFALLSAAVTAIFGVVAFSAALLVGGANGRIVTALTVVLATMVVSAGPRRRAERAVRRLVYGDRPQGFAVLGGLSDSLAAAGSAGEVAGRVVEAIGRGLSVPWVAVWLYVDGGGHPSLQPVAADGLEVAPIEPPAGTADLLVAAPRASLVAALAEPLATLLAPVNPHHPGAAAPLVAGTELVGVLVCGDRFRDPLNGSDVELLALVAHEAALGLANRRLETELRLRLEELRRSRQRLVQAQDAERRRVERDLHDGAQAQLVSLAADIRRMAATPHQATASTLSALATAAEEAVFALQDLARGIFPSVLTDRGLPAAVRAQAARMPMDVHVSVEPDLADRRLPGDVEAALYFVALEALGNAQKHAGEARVAVTLRLDEQRAAVLDVADDGPGFDVAVRAGPGSGLGNMLDRMDAIGGTLSVRSMLGGGSCVSAWAPLPPGSVAAG